MWGGDGEDGFIPLGGDDLIDGGGGDRDVVIYTQSIADYRVLIDENGSGNPILDVLASNPLKLSEGDDNLKNIEYLYFNDIGLPEIGLPQIRLFEYVNAANDQLDGDEEENWLIGDYRGNDIWGHDGEDYLFGGDGADGLNGGAGDDYLNGGDGYDVLDGGLGDDLIYGADGDDEIHAYYGADEVWAGTGGDEITVVSHTGKEGAPYIHGGGGWDVLTIWGSNIPDGKVGAPISFDMVNKAIEYGGAVGGFKDLEEVRGDETDDTWLMGEGDIRIYTGGGADQFFAVSQGNDIRAHKFDQSADVDEVTDIAFVSFKGGSYEGGVRIELQYRASTAGGGYQELYGYHDELAGFDEGARNPENLLNVRAFEGTTAGDMFYADGALGDESPDVAYDFEHKGVTYALTGSVFLGGKGSDVFVFSELVNLFDGGKGFDLANFSLDDIYGRDSFRPAPHGLNIDLNTGLVFDDTAPDENDDPMAYLFNVEAIVGTRVADVITGDDGDNYINGYQGKDIIDARGGDDYVEVSGGIRTEVDLGEGNDILAATGAEDGEFDGGDGIDTFEGIIDNAFRLDALYDDQALVDDTTYANVTGWDVDLEAGTAFIRQFEGNFENNDYPSDFTSTLSNFENVLGSNTTLADMPSWLDDQNYDFEGYAERLRGDDGTNVISGRAGEDLIDGRGGRDALDGGADNDAVYGGAGNDFVNGGDGNDIVDGGEGNDKLDGGAGDDQLLVSAGRDVYRGGEGIDRLNFGTFSLDVEVNLAETGWQNTGGLKLKLDGIENLRGGLGDDILKGDTGDNEIWGGAGDDLINGGKGDDTLEGNSGDDIFLFKGEHGHDLIDDWRIGDKIKVVGLTDFVSAEDLFYNHTEFLGNRVIITTGENSSITIRGSHAEHFNFDDILV